MDLTKAIEKIEANRVQAEASFVFCLWKDPQRYDDYKNINEGTDKTLICEEQVFYFMVGRGIRRQGFSNICPATGPFPRPSLPAAAWPSKRACRSWS